MGSINKPDVLHAIRSAQTTGTATPGGDGESVTEMLDESVVFAVG